MYPATSGKAPAVARLMRRLHADPRECVALFDDDNDLGMAALCAPGRRFAVSITHESVKQVRYICWGGEGRRTPWGSCGRKHVRRDVSSPTTNTHPDIQQP